MIEWLESIDHQIILAVNGWNSPLADKIMWIISGKYTYIPLYVFLILIAFKKLGWKGGLLFICCIVGCVALTDFICSTIIKDTIQRYRPSHNLLLTDLLHYHQYSDGTFYKGGQYGFISSHAGNFFTIAFFAGLVFRGDYKWLLPSLLILSAIVSYSRMYLGVHYLSDLIGGTIVGSTVGIVVFKYIFLRFKSRITE